MAAPANTANRTLKIVGGSVLVAYGSYAMVQQSEVSKLKKEMRQLAAKLQEAEAEQKKGAQLISDTAQRIQVGVMHNTTTGTRCPRPHRPVHALPFPHTMQSSPFGSARCCPVLRQ